MLGLLSSLCSLNFGYTILSSFLKRALRWLSFRRQLQNCCVWEPRFQEGSCHSPVRGAQTSTLCTNKCALCRTPAFLSPGTYQAEGAYDCDQPLWTPWALSLQWASLVASMSRTMLQFVAGWMESVPWDFSGRGLWKEAPGFLWLCPSRLFPLIFINILSLESWSWVQFCVLNSVSSSK